MDAGANRAAFNDAVSIGKSNSGGKPPQRIKGVPGAVKTAYFPETAQGASEMAALTKRGVFVQMLTLATTIDNPPAVIERLSVETALFKLAVGRT